MILPLEDLPVFQKDQNITGFNIDNQSIIFPEEPDFKALEESNKLFGGISEGYVNLRYFDRQSVKESKEYVDKANEDGNNMKVDHYGIDLRPDPIIYKVLKHLGNDNSMYKENLDDRHLHVIIEFVSTKFYMDIEQQYVIRSLIDKMHEPAYWFFSRLFAVFLMTFAIP